MPFKVPPGDRRYASIAKNYLLHVAAVIHSCVHGSSQHHFWSRLRKQNRGEHRRSYSHFKLNSTNQYSFQIVVEGWRRGVARAHPLFFAERYNPLAIAPSPSHNINVTIDGLAKLLHFGDYVEAKAEQKGISIENAIKEEIEAYPYTKKRDFQVV